jgi:hypothetical protein
MQFVRFVGPNVCPEFRKSDPYVGFAAVAAAAEHIKDMKIVAMKATITFEIMMFGV